MLNYNYYNEIKNELINNEVYKRVKDYSKNRNDLNTYYEVGKLLIEAQGGEDRTKYGDGLIKEYSIKLTNEMGKKYDITILKRMRQFYLLILLFVYTYVNRFLRFCAASQNQIFKLPCRCIQRMFHIIHHTRL